MDRFDPLDPDVIADPYPWYDFIEGFKIGQENVRGRQPRPAQVRRSRRVPGRAQSRGPSGLRRGIHFCLGASLARMEGAAVLGELVRRVRGFELAGPVERTCNPTLRGARRLSLRLAR